MGEVLSRVWDRQLAFAGDGQLFDPEREIGGLAGSRGIDRQREVMYNYLASLPEWRNRHTRQT